MWLVSWNVNSIRRRLDLVERFVQEEQPEVLALQETRCSDAQFPHSTFAHLGYESVHLGSGGHGGVAMLSNIGLNRVTYGFSGDHGPPFDEPRLISADVDGQRIATIYAPNGRRVRTSAWQFKLAWFELLRTELTLELDETDELLVMGDFNVCPTDADLYNPAKKRDRNLVSVPERAALQRILDLGLTDVGELHHAPDERFTWFSHAEGQFESNLGYRLDLVLATSAVSDRILQCRPLREWRVPELGPSDHVPVATEIANRINRS
ncbi:MAG: exodeoxyribonuclease III [Acidimicrobiia bacterium]|nr:exodeoxyribonuclease III [Acidimicrobiia bacterium]